MYIGTALNNFYMNITLKSTIKSFGFLLAGVTAHHYGGKILDHKENVRWEQETEEKFSAVIKSLKNIENKVDSSARDYG